MQGSTAFPCYSRPRDAVSHQYSCILFSFPCGPEFLPRAPPTAYRSCASTFWALGLSSTGLLLWTPVCQLSSTSSPSFQFDLKDVDSSLNLWIHVFTQPLLLHESPHTPAGTLSSSLCHPLYPPWNCFLSSGLNQQPTLTGPDEKTDEMDNVVMLMRNREPDTMKKSHNDKRTGNNFVLEAVALLARVVATQAPRPQRLSFLLHVYVCMCVSLFIWTWK